MDISTALIAIALMTVVTAGCGPVAEDPTGAPEASVSAGSDVADSVPSSVAEDAVPSPVSDDAVPSAETGPTSWYPWLPQIDTSDDAALPMDSFVRAAADPVPVSAAPGGPPFRFDDGDPSRTDAPLIGIPRGTLLVVVHGPVGVDGSAWYLVTPAGVTVDIPTGWSPVVSATGSRYLQPTDFACPPSPVEAASLSRAVLTDGLPACYGDDEVTIVGDLICDGSTDTYATGASWLDDGTCRFDVPPSVFGLDPELAPGRYAVTGRFLDDEARSCRSRDGDDTPEGRLSAVLYCRRAFIAGSATPASS